MKQTIFQSLLFSVAFIFLYYVVQFGLGFYMTLNYVPDIINSYQSVDYLQNKVEFGYIARPYGVLGEIFGLLVIGMILFLLGKLLWKRVKRTGP